MESPADALWQRFRSAPGDPSAFRALTTGLAEAGDLAGLVRAYETRAGAVVGLESLLLELTIAEKFSRDLADRGVADAAYDRALDRASTDVEQRDLLRELFWKRGRWALLERILTYEAEEAEPGEERGGAYLELARFRAVKLDQPEAAAAAYRQALRESPEARLACREELEGLFRDNPTSEPLADALATAYREEGDYSALYGLMEHRLTTLPLSESSSRFGLQMAAARLAGRDLGRWDRAIEHLRGACRERVDRAEEVITTARELRRLAPDEDRLLAFIEETARGRGDWDSTLESVLARLSASSDPAAQARGHLEAAEILWHHLDRRLEALEHYEAALARDPAYIPVAAERYGERLQSERDSAARDALEARLEELLRSGDLHEGLLSLLTGRLDRTDAPDRRVALLCEMGDLLLERLRDPARAIEPYLRASEEAEATGRVDDIMERLFRIAEAVPGVERVEARIEGLAGKTKRWDDLLRLLNRRLESATSDPERAAVHERVGDLLLGSLDQPDAAAHHLVRAAELDPTRADFHQKARRALRSAGQYRQAFSRFPVELAATPHPAERAELVCEVAEMLQRDLDDPLAALRLILEHTTEGPGEERLRGAIRTLLMEASGLEWLTTDLDTIAAHPSPGLTLGRAATVAARACVDPWAERLDELQVALLQAIDQRCGLSEAHQALLEAALEQTERFDALATTLERRAQRAERSQARTDALTKLLALLEGPLDDPEAAVGVYWQLIQAAPQDLERVRAFEAVLATDEEPAGLARLYDLVLEVVDPAQTPEARALLASRAALEAGPLGRPDRAADSYRRLLSLDPQHEAAVAFFRSQYQQAEDAPSLYRVLAESVDAIEEPAARQQRRAELGSIAWEHLRDADLAASHWEAVLDEADASPQASQRAIDGLRALYAEGDQNERLLSVVQRELALVEAETRTARLREMVDLLEGLGRHKEALAAIDELVAAGVDDLELLERAADDALQLDDPAREADYVRRMIAVAPERDDICLRLARILADELNESDEALTLMTQILAGAPGHPIVLDAAEQLLTRLGRFEHLIELLRSQAERAEDDPTRVRVLLSLADLATLAALTEDPKEDVRAWALQRVLEIEPERRDVATQLAQHLEDRKAWEPAVEALNRLVELSESDTEKADVLRRAGSILEHEVEDIPEARATFTRLAELGGGDAGAVQALIRLARKAQDEAALPGLVARLLVVAPDAQPEEQRVLVHQAVDVAEASDETLGQAIDLLVTWAERQPTDRESLERLAGLVERAEDWVRLASVLERMTRLASDEQQWVELTLRRAEILDERLGELEAAAHCYADVLQIHSANRLALNALKRIFTELKKWPEVLQVLSRMAQLDRDPAVRAAIYREAAEVQQTHLEAPDRAMALHRMAHDLLLNETTSLEAMYRLAEAHDLWEPYVEVLRQGIDRSGTPTEQRARLMECASVIETRLNDPSSAFDLLFERFDATPRDSQLFEAMVELCLRSELWDALDVTYRRLIKTQLEPTDKVVLYRQLAAHLTEAARDPQRALEVLREAHVLRPDDQDTTAQMEALAADHDLWDELDQIYQERWRETTGVRQRVSLLTQRAELLESKLERWQDAFDQLVMAFQLRPDQRDLEEQLYTYADRYEQWETVLKLFELMVKERTEPALRSHLLEQMAWIATDKLGESARAFDFIGRAWRLDPSRDSLRERLAETARATDRLADLADAYEWESAHRADPADRLAALERLANLCADELGDLDRAVRAYTAAFRQDPGRAATIEGLREMLLTADQGRALLRTLAGWVAYTRSPDERIALFRSMAHVSETLGWHQEALEAYRGVLGEAPKDLVALDGLSRLHRSVGAWDRVVRCVEQALEVAEDADRRYALFRELSQAYLELDRPEQAIETLERSIEAFPDHPWPTEELIELHIRVDQPGAAVALLERVGERAEPGEAADALLLGAEIAVVKLDDIRRAVRLCNRVTRLVPDEPRAWTLLADLAELTERWRDQANAFLALADLPASRTAEPDPAKLEVLNGALAQAELPPGTSPAALPPPSSRELYLGLAALILEQRLYYRDKALAQWQRAAQSGWALAEFQVATLAERLERDDLAEDAYRRGLAALERAGLDEALSRGWSTLAGRIAATPGRALHALTGYEAALTANPRNEAAYRGYERLLREQTKLERGAELFARLLSDEADPPRRRALLVLGARVLDALGRRDEAEKQVREAHQLGRDDPLVNLALADTAFEAGDYARAVELYQTLLERSDSQETDARAGEADTEHDLRLHKRLAMAAERAGRADLAQKHYGSANAIAPDDAATLLGLARMALVRGATALAENYLEEAVRGLDERAPEQVGALMVRASIAGERGNPAATIALLEQAARHGGEHAREPLERLVELYGNRGRWEDALATLVRLETLAASHDERVAWLMMRAEIARDRLGQTEEAWAALSEVIAAGHTDPAILRQGLELAVGIGQWSEASKLADRLLPTLTEPPDVAHCRVLAGAAAAGTGQLEVARRHYSSAVRLDSFNTRAIEGLVATATRQEDWRRLRQELSAALARVGTARPAVRGLLMRALADLLSGALLNRQAALKIYDELAELYPADVAIHRKRLETLLRAQPVDGRAVATAVQHLAELGVVDPDGLRFLQQWHADAGRPDGAFVMTVLLGMCGEASPEEVRLARRQPHAVGPEVADAMTEELIEQNVRANPAPAPVRHALAEAAAALGSAESAMSGAPHPRHAEFQRLAAALGQPRSQLLAAEQGRPSAVINAPVVTALMARNGPNGSDGSEAQMRFALGLLAYQCQPHAIMCSTLSEFDYVTFHTAAMAPLRSDAGGPVLDEGLAAVVAQWWEAFGWPDGRPPDRDLDEAEPLTDEAIPTPTAWRVDTIRTARRVALLYCDSPEDAMAYLLARDPALVGRSVRSLSDLQEVMAASDAVRDLFAFMVSESHVQARERLGLARSGFDLTQVEVPEAQPESLDDKAVGEFELEIEEGTVDPSTQGAT